MSLSDVRDMSRGLFVVLVIYHVLNVFLCDISHELFSWCVTCHVLN